MNDIGPCKIENRFLLAAHLMREVEDQHTHHIDFAKIIDGSLDATIMARANGSKALGTKFFLDFAAEMNGDEAWSGNNPPYMSPLIGTFMTSS